MSKQYSASVVIQGFDKASNAIRNVTRQLEKLQKVEGIQRMQKAWAGVGTALDGVGHEAGLLAQRFTILAGAGVGLFAAFVKPAAQMETLRTRLDNLYNSTIMGGKAFDFLTRYAVKTPYTFMMLADSMAMLKGQGIDGLGKNFQSIMNYLSAFVPDTERAQRAILGISHAWGKGKLQARELNQLVYAGVQIYPMLQKVTGKTQEQLMEMAKAGKLNHDVMQKLFDLMAIRGKGVGKGVSDLFNTKMTNIIDAWQVFAYKIMNTKIGDITLFGQMKKDMDSFREFLLTGFNGPAGQKMARFMSDLYGVFKELAIAAIPVAQELLKMWEGFTKLTGGTKNAVRWMMVFMALPFAASVANLAASLASATIQTIAWGSSVETVNAVGWPLLGLWMKMQPALLGMSVGFMEVGAATSAFGLPFIGLLAPLAVFGSLGVSIFQNWDPNVGLLANLKTGTIEWANSLNRVIDNLLGIKNAQDQMYSGAHYTDTFYSGGRKFHHTSTGAMMADFDPKQAAESSHRRQRLFQPHAVVGKQVAVVQPKKDTLEVNLKIEGGNGAAKITGVRHKGDSHMAFGTDRGLTLRPS